MFAFVLLHLINHALGLISLQAMNAGAAVLTRPWGSPPGFALLGGAFVVHFSLALYSIWRRRSLRMRFWEAAQLGLGVAIPPLLAEHVAGTLGAESAVGMNPDYAYVQLVLWVGKPMSGVLQAVVLVVAWVHGAIGLHYWLRLKPWYGAALPGLYAAALLVPVLALSGFVASGFAVMRLAQEPGFIDAVLDAARASPEATLFVGRATAVGQAGAIGLVVLAFVLRWVRIALARRRGLPRLTYPDGRTVEVLPGASVLETSRAAGIPHASVCGGRGRCSTCRIRIGEGAASAPPPSPEEVRVLQRIGAPPNVRLACQLRPTHDLEVVPLLAPAAGPQEGFRRPAWLAGQEREIAILFADLRGFTRLADARLPFDVVYVLNRYFAAMGEAVEAAGGRLDKFIGDGVMALFGVEGGPEEGCRQALAAARRMGAALEELNRSLAGDLLEPLRMGIGIHVGHAIVGEMGYGHAKSLTAIGDAVNLASRLEGLTKDLAVQLVLSDDVARRAGVDLSGHAARHVDVRGKSGTITVRAVPALAELEELS
jgi:adenylate cyclase